MFVLKTEVTMLHSSAARPSESTAYSTAARMAATCGQIFSLSMYHAFCQKGACDLWAAFACNAATLQF